MISDKELEDFLARLNPKTAQSFRKASEIQDEVLSTPSLGMNMALDGGIGYGRFTTLYGNKGSGKTAWTLQACAEAQREGKIIAWLDVEKNFSPHWARRLGLDPDRMFVSRNIISIADMADEARDLIVKGADVVVVDSISQLMPESYFEQKDGKNKGEIKSLSNTGQIGTFAKNIGSAINIINGVNQKTAVIFISQLRNKIGMYGASMGLMGGFALEHASSTIIKFWRAPSDLITKEVHIGDGLLLPRPVGAKVTWTLEKHRGSGMGNSNEYDFYFAGDDVGVDLASECVVYGLEYGVLGKSGNWIKYGDEQRNGKNAFVDYLHEEPDILEKVYGEIVGKSV